MIAMEHDLISLINFKNKNIGYTGSALRMHNTMGTSGKECVTRLLIHTIKVELCYGLIDNRCCVQHDTHGTERTETYHKYCAGQGKEKLTRPGCTDQPSCGGTSWHSLPEYVSGIAHDYGRHPHRDQR